MSLLDSRKQSIHKAQALAQVSSLHSTYLPCIKSLEISAFAVHCHCPCPCRHHKIFLSPKFQCFQIHIESQSTFSPVFPMARKVDYEMRRRVEERLIGEECKQWMKNVPQLYNLVITQLIEWPSITVEWLPDRQEPSGKDYAVQTVVLGTQTMNNEPNYLLLVQVELPLGDEDSEEEEGDSKDEGKEEEKEADEDEYDDDAGRYEDDDGDDDGDDGSPKIIITTAANRKV